MKIIFLHGKKAICTTVDDEDYEKLNKFRWYATNTGRGKGGPYVCRNGPRNEHPRKKIYMHRVIMNTPKGMETDHINRITWDNRKQNLRSVNKLTNLENRKH